MCDCKYEIEEKLLARFIEDAPDAKGHSAELLGYTLVMGPSISIKGQMQIELCATFPKKGGGVIAKKQKTTMVFTYCPFCSKKYED